MRISEPGCERIGTGRHASTGLQPWVMIVNGTGVSHSAADGGNGSNIKTLHTCLIPVGGGREKICRTLPLPGSARDRCGTVGRGLECLHGQLLRYVWHDSCQRQLHPSAYMLPCCCYIWPTHVEDTYSIDVSYMIFV